MTQFDAKLFRDHKAVSANIFEGVDAPFDPSTPYVMGVGDTFFGNLNPGTDPDLDSIRLSVVAGETYEIALIGGVGTAINDPYLFVLDGAGNLIGEDDDGGPGATSLLTFTASFTGDVFLIADSFTSEETGSYALSVEFGTPPVAPPPGTYEEMQDYLTDGFWEDFGEMRHSFDTSVSNVIYVDITALQSDGVDLARWAFEAWEMIADVDFVERTAAEIANGDEVDISFIDTDDGAYAIHTSELDEFGNETTTTESALVNIGQTDWIDFYGTSIDSYSFSTYIHEIGHALGLGHMGNYNGNASFPSDATFGNDSLQLSVMSYFSVTQNTTVVGTDGEVLTAQMIDILAIQELYGAADGGATAGNTIYGAGSNLNNYFGDFFIDLANGTISDFYQGGAVAFTIFDEGGTDTIDLSFFNDDVEINLNDASFSSVGGINNIAIAVGTELENLILGGGDDTVVQNDSVANDIDTGAGNDTIVGIGYGDVIDGGADTDTIVFSVSLAEVTSLPSGIITFSGTTITFDDGIGAASTISNVEFIELTDQLMTFADFQAAVEGASEGGEEFIGSGIDDIFMGTEFDDTATGFGGNDTFDGFGGADTLYGGGGADVLSGGADDDYIEGGNNGDDLFGDEGEDRIFGGLGADDIYGGDDLDRLYGDDGDDDIVGDAGNDRLFGGAGNDDLFGGIDNDSIDGGADNDFIDGGDGADWLKGGLGEDTIFGGIGDDEVFGSKGADTVYGDEGADTLSGEKGRDVIYGGDDNDVIYGGVGKDKIFGDAGADEIYGGDDKDIIKAGSSSDTVYGGDGSDKIFGANGSDELFGGEGDDFIYGGSGSDILESGSGNDQLFGGSSSDTFVFMSGDEGVTVRDFEAGIDVIALDATLLYTDPSLFDIDDYVLSDTGGTLVLDFGAVGDILTFDNGATRAEIEAAVIFV